MAVKKKLLFVNNFLEGGGVEKLLYDLVWHLHDKYDITVLTYDYCKGAEELYPEDVHYLSGSVKRDIPGGFVARQLNRINRKLYQKIFWKRMKKRGFDIAIAIKEGQFLKDVAEMDYIPVKYGWVHTDYNNYYYTYDLFGGPENELNCFRKLDKVVCVSEDIRQSILDQIGDPGNLEMLYNPIDVANILERAEEPVVDEAPLPTPGVPRFVTVGRLNQQKGYDLLLEACHMLEEDGLKFEVWVVGAKEPWSDEHNRLFRRQRKLGLKSVKFLGGRKNPYKYMKAGDWFLSTSIFEGYSLVSQEAAVLDIPLILTDCSGVRELIGDSEYGVVMEISVLDIYRKMKMVIEHPELHEHYQKKIMERKAIINFDERLKQIEDLFNK